MTDAQVTDKFQRMTEGLLDDATRRRVLDMCWHLEELKHVGDLIGQFPAMN
jgi:hypothetical protein